VTHGYNRGVFKVRRIILKLTVALGAIPLGMMVIFIPMIGMVLGNSGHQLGSHYVLRYVDEYHTLKIYRDSYPWGEFGFPDLAPLLGQYGLVCLAVAGVEGFIRFLERRNRSREGFEVVVPSARGEGEHGH